jgi:hypothetical protein
VHAGADAENPRRLQCACHERTERSAEREAQGRLVERVVDVCTHVETVLRGGIGEIEIPQGITWLSTRRASATQRCLDDARDRAHQRIGGRDADRQVKSEIGLGETPARVSGARHIANVSAQLRNVCNSAQFRGQRSSGRFECAAYLGGTAHELIVHADTHAPRQYVSIEEIMTDGEVFDGIAQE